MNSIDANQPEKNYQDVRGEDAVKKIREVVKHANSGFFCTQPAGSGPEAARPMYVQQVDDDGNLWFFSATDSHKNQEIAANPFVRLYFQGSNSEFLLVDGRAAVLHDRAKIDELWGPMVRVWFTQGKDDPRLSLIRVSPTGGYYWDTKHGMAVAGVKMVIGMMTGNTLDDGIQGRVAVQAPTPPSATT
ncbi:MAG: pyridoxamine 5'-phosphate oxidase family protein [Planctomycetota bacterium]|nr:pyridoxamine 5'-phosphate oxidase family protein [Planctomycetota bacterium]